MYKQRKWLKLKNLSCCILYWPVVRRFSKYYEYGWHSSGYSLIQFLQVHCNEFSAYPPFLSYPPLYPACSLLCKIFFPFPSFLLHSFLRYFRQFSPPSCRQPPSFLNPWHQTSLHIINVFKQILKGWFYQLYRCYFFNCLDTFSNISGYRNLWVFSGLFLDNLEWLFFMNLRWQKNLFFQMHNTILYM